MANVKAVTAPPRSSSLLHLDLVETRQCRDARMICDSTVAFYLGTPEGHPVAHNNGIHRDGTRCFTVDCTDKDCKKRQLKALKMSFKDSASVSDILLIQIVVLMRVSNAVSWVKNSRPRSRACCLAWSDAASLVVKTVYACRCLVGCIASNSACEGIFAEGESTIAAYI